MDRASSARILAILVAVGLLLGGLAGALRHRLAMEHASKTTELALDYDSYSEFLHAQGIEEDQGFKDLHSRGASAISFNENYMQTLQLGGHVKLYSGLDLARVRSLENVPAAVALAPQRQYVVVYDDSTFNDLKSVLSLLVGQGKVTEWGRLPGDAKASPGAPRVLEVVGSERFLNTLGLGFSSELVEHFRRLGFHIILRPENKTSVAPDMLHQYFSSMPKAEYIVFGGVRNEALGYPVPDCLDAVLRELADHGLRLGIVEVPTPKAALKGEEYLAQHYVQAAVRVQSIAPAQLARLQPDDAIDMFRLGVRERNVRMVFLRPFADPDPLRTLTDTNSDYVSGVASMLQQNGYQISLASTFPGSEVPLWSALLLNMAVGASLSLLLLYLRPHTPPSVLWLGPVLMAGGCLGMMHHAGLWSKLSALAAALAIPSLAMMRIQDRLDSFKAEGSVTRGQAVIRSLVWLLEASVVSLAGGLLVASLLASTPFMLEIDQFRGIKLLMIVPPLLVLLYAAIRQGTSVLAQGRQLWDIPLTVGSALCLLLVLAGGVFYIMRTGNTPETGAADWERSLRVVLQNVFIARPRFKDFCIGHPAFVVLGVLTVLQAGGAVAVRRPLMWLLLVLATIGQADIVDTFAHIHTPFLISLLRVFNGLWLGALVGLVVCAFIRPKALSSGRGAPAAAAPSQPATAAPQLISN